MYYTIYKITNQVNGKIYIGSHKTKDLNDDYMGSGKYLKHSQEKYGIDKFTKEILFVFETVEEMYAKEAELVNEEFLATENTYNLKIGGYGGWDYINSSEETRIQKNKKAREKANESIKRLYGVDNPAKLNSVKEALSRAMKKRISNGFKPIPPSFSGKTHKEETKEKIRNSNKGKHVGCLNSQYGTMWITNGSENKKIKKYDSIPEGWRKGKVQSRV